LPISKGQVEEGKEDQSQKVVKMRTRKMTVMDSRKTTFPWRTEKDN
jgi:hypothetical protein